MRKIRVVAALIRDEQGRCLVQQRPANKAQALLWEFPGGKIEPGEEPEAALAREGREELDVDLDIGRLLWSTVHDYPQLQVDLRLYSAQIRSGEPRPLAANALRFASVTEMRTLPFCEADRPLLEALAEGRVG